uniref:L-serine ammonia-lyase n=1 Tax=Dendroctonus ponderosae TaxID=77166 RepID=A0AAR5NZK8_DENPD
MRQQGAEVIVHGEIWTEANELALQFVNSEAIYIHPFDDQYLWDGVAKIIDETIEDGIIPSAVVLSVGGGSLLSETEGTASLNTAIKMGQHIKLDKVTGVATTLAAQQVCKNAFELTQLKEIKGITVTDEEAIDACFKFLDDHRTLVEPACGATLATLYNKKMDFSPSDNILVIIWNQAHGMKNSLELWLCFYG